MSSPVSAAPSRLRYDRARLAALSVAYLVAILLLDLFSKRIERMNSVAAFFPADGLALAFLYVVGLRLTPVVFLGYSLSATLLFGVPWPLALAASAAGSGLQAGTVALLRRVLHGDLARGRMSDLGKFLIAVTTMAVSGGLLLRLTLLESGDITPQQSTAAFFTICTGLALAPERSAIVSRWFGPTAGQASFVDYIEPIDADFARSFELNYEALTEDVLPIELCLEQLPTRLRHGDLTFEVSYLPLGAGGPRDGLLVVINDITRQLKAAQQDAEQRELLAAFQGFARDRTGFLSFLDEAGELVKNAVTASSDFVTQKRLVHTLKANSAMIGLISMAQLCHQIEDELEENASVQLTPLIRALGDRWLAFTQSVRAFLGDRDRGVIELPAGELALLCQALKAGLPVDQAVERLTTLGFEPVEIHLGRLAAQARALSQRLGKGEPVIELEARGPRLDPARWAPLFSELVHLVRNAVDHGFEPPEQRAAAGKTSRPRLRLSSSLREGKLAIEIEDDGRGIDWPAVQRSAVRHGLRAETEAELTAALFAAGVTSRDQVSDTSGRGVGMAGVYARVQELEGSVTVSSRLAVGTCWTLSFPFSSLPR